jgi:hypothetical protein
MNFKARLNKVLEKLGFVKKFENKSLTSEEYKALCEEYQKEYQSTLVDDLAAENSAAEEAEHQQQINSLYAIVSKANNAAGDGDNDDEGKDSDDDKKNENSQQPTGASQNVSYEQLTKAVSGLAENVMKMAQGTAPDKPAAHVTAPSIPINGFESNSNYLFGIEHSLFDMKKRWNQITVNPALAASSTPDESTGIAFRKEAMAYAVALQQRYNYHQSRNELRDTKALASGQFSTNYNGVDNAGLGDQFVILRQDALIARILELRNLTEFFPVRYGVQDRDVLFNAFFDEVSQGYQEGEIYKGGMQLENEMGYVDDAMIKVKFGPMKELERKYIAYLNKEGSDPIKWSMIEFCLLNLLKKAQDEQNQRRMRGIYVKPEAGQPSSFLNAGTGIWYTLLRYIHDYSIKPFANKSYNTYTSANMLDAVKEFITDVKTHLSEGMTIDNHVLYLNENHIDWWLANCRETYGKDLDFTGPDGYKNRVPDSTIQIKWLPYEGKSCWMFMDVPGNIQFIEYLPGEMLAVRMEEQMESVRAWSTWKEGCGAAFTGRKFDSKAAMDDNDYEFQQIFTNLPATVIGAEINGANGFWQITDETTTATTIEDISNAKAGVAYCIEIGKGDTKHQLAIAKSGKFANITAAWSPTQVGDYIMVILGKGGNFRELERCVGGKRTVNKAVQPNVPGGR